MKIVIASCFVFCTFLGRNLRGRNHFRVLGKLIYLDLE
jgi:hypothetical protein